MVLEVKTVVGSLWSWRIGGCTYCGSSIERFEQSRLLYTVLVFHLRVYCVQFTHNILCGKDSDPIFIEISWIHERIEARVCGFGIVLLLSSKKKVSLRWTLVPVDKFGSYIFYDGWHRITAFVISGNVLYLIKGYGSLLSIHLLTRLINIMAPQQTSSPYTHFLTLM